MPHPGVPETLPLFAAAEAGWKKRWTSRHTAREIVRSGRADALRRRVLEALQAKGGEGATVHELVLALNEIKDNVAPRLSELSSLKHGALVKDSGRTRLSPSGKPCIVWVTA